ncbi:MAG: hypothetical protein OXI74_18600 [Rhodospirillaceae bacterium]|nr:hypothetical protein [Rhodospirillaceae bacterium]
MTGDKIDRNGATFRMVTGRKSGILLALLIVVFAVVGAVQWIAWPDSPAGIAGPDASVSGRDPPSAETTLDNVMLIYADAISHVAGRYLEAESYETGILLLERVIIVRRGVLGPEHPRVKEAEARHAAAVKVSRGEVDKDLGYPSNSGSDQAVHDQRE